MFGSISSLSNLGINSSSIGLFHYIHLSLYIFNFVHLSLSFPIGTILVIFFQVRSIWDEMNVSISVARNKNELCSLIRIRSV